MNGNRRTCRHFYCQWRHKKINKNLIWDICNIQGFKIKGDASLKSLARKHKKFCENRNYEHEDFIVNNS